MEKRKGKMPARPNSGEPEAERHPPVFSLPVPACLLNGDIKKRPLPYLAPQNWGGGASSAPQT